MGRGRRALDCSTKEERKEACWRIVHRCEVLSCGRTCLDIRKLMVQTVGNATLEANRPESVVVTVQLTWGLRGTIRSMSRGRAAGGLAEKSSEQEKYRPSVAW